MFSFPLIFDTGLTGKSLTNAYLVLIEFRLKTIP